MRTYSKMALGEIAIKAQYLETRREVVFSKPFTHITTNYSFGFAMFIAFAINVINGHEFDMRFSTAGALG